MRHTLFDTSGSSITVLEAANMVQVSVATINNWLKKGLLKSPSKGYVSADSVKAFSLRQEKLKSRANKQHKDSHNHEEVSSYISKKIEGTDSESLSSIYENSLSESYRNREGIYYTPIDIVRDMLECIPKEEIEEKIFLEPCCGSGNFIVEAIRKGFRPENIYAFDTDLNAIKIAKKRVYELTGYHSEKIVQGDFLTICKTLPIKADYIFTNPPWGKKLPRKIKQHYALLYNAGESSDSCSLFFFACLSNLKDEGKMGFLLPESFFNISSFEQARCQALNYQIEQFNDYGRFGKLMTRAQAITLSKRAITTGLIKCKYEGKTHFRRAFYFNQTPKHIFNFQVHEAEAETIAYLFSVPHKTLRGRAQWGLGVVTGDNSKLLVTEQKRDYIPIFRGKDISKKGFSSPRVFINKGLSGCQQVAAKELYLAPEKIVYRFIGKELIFYCDRGRNYILNSANLLIPDNSLGISMQQITDLLNSEVINWLFNKIFHTTKILRGDLELLPIYVGYYQIYETFNEDDFLDYLNIEKQNGTYRVKRAHH